MDHRRESMFMSKILRHQAINYGLKIRSDGYVEISKLLKIGSLTKLTLDDIEKIVAEDNKNRFRISDDKKYIRANQGHSIECVDDDLLLEKILDHTNIPVCIHGTDSKALEFIKKEGLHIMGRNHIHFSSGKLGEEGVISGMRKNCKVFVYIDTEKAMKNGIKFFKSANGVILSPGNWDGYIIPEYFKTIEIII